MFAKRLAGKSDNKPAADVAAVADLINLRRLYPERCMVERLGLSNLGSSGRKFNSFPDGSPPSINRLLYSKRFQEGPVVPR